MTAITNSKTSLLPDGEYTGWWNGYTLTIKGITFSTSVGIKGRSFQKFKIVNGYIYHL